MAVITDLCILHPDPFTRELKVASVHPEVAAETIVASTGWRVEFANDCGQTAPPTRAELDVLRDLKARTEAAHGMRGEAE